MKSSNTYLIGTCYLCTRCLYCNQNTFLKSCKCIKTQIPNKKNRTKEVPWAFKLNYREDFSTKQFDLLEEQNKICNYNVDFSLDFQFSLCSSCNTKWYRAKNSEPVSTISYQRPISLNDNISINNDVLTNYKNSNYNNLTISNHEEKPISMIKYQRVISLDDNTSINDDVFTSNNNIITIPNYEEDARSPLCEHAFYVSINNYHSVEDPTCKILDWILTKIAANPRKKATIDSIFRWNYYGGVGEPFYKDFFHKKKT
ncbi:22807_t:CDS:2 [Dentiscutata erythropus]|uniref:22807_t:CDS:1 n=1 Tax=Dentiscutata erythropus TaxID=1348616 RepID=A0A9N8VXV8_9GLOM|nr:22807_t:CDS:2 [Dentiscutata erythropus]